MPRLLHASLVRAGRISEAALASARRKAQEIQMSLEYVLRTEHGLGAQELGASLAEHHRTEFVAYRDGLRPLPDLLEKMNADLCAYHRCVPVAREGRKIVVLMENPSDLPTRDQVEALLGAPLLAKAAFAEDIHRILRGEEPRPSVPPPPLPAAAGPEPAVDLLEAGESPVVHLTNMILAQAWRGGAEEIRIHPKEEPHVAVRAAGSWTPQIPPPVEMIPALVRRLKVMASLDSTNAAKPARGSLELRLPDGRVSVEVATTPVGDGLESAVLRLRAS